MFQSVIKGFFFGNYFYGICAVALSIEAALQQEYPLNKPYYYGLVFALTVWFYTLAYITDPALSSSKNPRTNWYIQHKTFVKYSQLFCLLLGIIVGLYIVYTYWHELWHIRLNQLIPLLLTPLAAIFYYGLSFLPRYNLRKIGWLKPFVIGFTWAGLITIAPIIFYNLTHQSGQGISPIGWWLLLKNFMFVSVLCIMFDIKDYATDSNHNVKTFVVKKGLRFTIFSIILPLTIAGLISFLIFGTFNHFSQTRLILNVLPFVAMISVCYALKERRNIFFYLIIIDGLMFFKAACGIIASL
ncbi:hypothetical protein [Emticicia agri]|uniref:UbiA prenyltransferase family protein n=1 Tax=Emticicia agri TaxID=2492393 RepID=A0A4Q5M696_9BACT|nr:hypothetical protein [Emticicia agri]RYU97497.1 hypothetical protein EWM59_02055 [Emticicia agri]